MTREAVIQVDNAVRLYAPPALLDADERRLLTEPFDHENPKRASLKFMGLPHWSEPKRIQTFGSDGDWMVFPRGGFAIVREQIKALGFTLRFIDKRIIGHAVYDMPDSRVALRDYQARAVDAIVEKQNCLLRAPTGCLVGETRIGINRAGKDSTTTLKTLVHMFQGGGIKTKSGSMNGKVWDRRIPTFVRAPMPNGTVRLQKLVDATESGKRRVYRVTCAKGFVEGTIDHKLLTPFGWVQIGHLLVGDNLLFDEGILKSEVSRKEKPWYKLRTLEPVKILSIEYVGERETYDLEVEGAHAFMANGIAVHNSGKTSMGIAMIGRLKVSALVVVWTSGLAEQWRDRVEAELGIPRREIGEWRGQKYKPGDVTIAMQQTVSAAAAIGSKALDDAKARFGLVMMDEVQRAPAKTFFAAIEPFPAVYRVGLSADERRKDRMDFLTRDLFGTPAADISQKSLIATGSVLDVEILVVPTEFAADWYGLPDDDFDIEKSIDTSRLLDEMSTDVERNAIAIEHARAALDRGKQVILMSHRREHALALEREFVRHGYRVGQMLGGKQSEAEFRRTVAALKSGRVQIGFGTYQAVGQGLDLPSVAVAVCTTPIAANKQQFGQVRGRVCRPAPGKDKAQVVYLWDRRVFPGHLKNLCAWNERVMVKSAAGRWIDADEYLARHNRF